jgi:hypothetical protein
VTDDLDPLGEIAEWRREREVRERNERTLRPGIYRTAAGSIYRVRLNRQKSRVYSERWTLVEGRYKFEYDPDAITRIEPEDRMQLEEARQVSREVGQCLACSTILTDPESQAAGIGPDCSKKWTYDQAVEDLKRTILPMPKQSVCARDAGDRIVISSQYDDTIIGVIKTFPGYAWDDRAREWSLPREHAADLAEAFEAVGIAHDDIVAIALDWATAT